MIPATEALARLRDGCRCAARQACFPTTGLTRMREFATRGRAALALTAMSLTACAPLSQSVVPLDGAPAGDASQVARIREGGRNPLLLRGLDGVRIDTLRVPSALSDYVYAVKPGRHTLWTISMPFGHPLAPQRVRCYVIDVETVPGVRYRHEEEPDLKLALIRNDDTGERVASGRLVDEQWVFLGGCRWQ